MEILRDQPGFLGTGASLTPAATAEAEAAPAETPEVGGKDPGK